ncbi:MAG: prepilin peptidase [Burkholderiaceae bacterium]|nr:prepilin peptidase [Burkholderiaceae bacterium]
MISWAAVCLIGLGLGWVVARFSGAYIASIAAGDSPDVSTFWRAALSLINAQPFQHRQLWLIMVVQTLCCVWFYRQGGGAAQFFALTAGTALLQALACIDARTGLLPNTLTYPFLALGLLLALAGVGVGFWPALLGAVGGYVFLWLASSAFRVVTGQVGIGRGDLKLFAGLGAWVGLAGLWFLLLMACLMGVGFAMWRQRSVYPRGNYPFGPFLAMAGIGTLLMVMAA